MLAESVLVGGPYRIPCIYTLIKSMLKDRKCFLLRQRPCVSSSAAGPKRHSTKDDFGNFQPGLSETVIILLEDIAHSGFSYS